MDFAPEGWVHACCVNAAWPLGDVREQTLREIWDGERAQALRAAVRRGDFGHGCGNCRHRLEHDTGNADVLYYREMPAPADPAWPEVMAFGLSNTCNLACVMCGGNLSSKLRAIEGRPRLEPAYGDRFFEELAGFLPHLRRAEFRGGEPFLIREHHRVWGLLTELGLQPEVQVTTNGTLWDDRVTRVLEAFPTQITFSLDGLDEAVNNSIRVGTDQPTVLANARRFAAYAQEVGSRFDLSFCVLQQNWQELAGLVRFAEELGGEAHAQIVLERSQGLHRLPDEELVPIIDELARQGESLGVSEVNQRTWDRMVDWLRGEVRQRRQGAMRIWEGPGPENLPHARDRRAAARAVDADVDGWRSTLADWSTNGEVGELHTDADDRVVLADLEPVCPPDRPGAPGVLGSSSLDALGALADHLGRHVWVIDEFDTDGVVEQTLFLAPTELRDKSGLVLRLVSTADGAGGVRTLLAADTCFWPTARPNPVPVSVR